MNMVLTVNPITVITKFTAEDVIFFSQNFPRLQLYLPVNSPIIKFPRKFQILFCYYHSKQNLRHPTCKITRKSKSPDPLLSPGRKKDTPSNIFSICQEFDLSNTEYFTLNRYPNFYSTKYEHFSFQR